MLYDDNTTVTVTCHDNLRLARGLLGQLASHDRHLDVSQHRALAKVALPALDDALGARTPADGTITPSLRLEYVLVHGWPNARSYVGSAAGDPYSYWGTDAHSATRYPTPLAAIDAAIVAAGMAAPPTGEQVQLPPLEVPGWQQRLPGPAASCEHAQIDAAKDAEIADLRAAARDARIAVDRLRTQNAHQRARIALLSARPTTASVGSDYDAARAAVIGLLHASGMADDEIAEDLSLNAMQVLMIRTCGRSHAAPDQPRDMLHRERALFELGERHADLSREGPSAANPNAYVDPDVRNRFAGWLRRAGVCPLPALSLPLVPPEAAQ